MSQAGLLVPVFPVVVELGLLLAAELVLDLVVAVEEDEALLAMGFVGALVLLAVEFLAATFSGGLVTALTVVGAVFTRLAAGPFCVI